MGAALDLFVEMPVLGDTSRFVRQAGVSFGRLTVGPAALDELPDLTRRRLDLDGLRFSQIVLPFDLEDLPSGRRYIEATVRMAFDDSAVLAVAMSQPPATAGQDCDLDTWGVGSPQLAWKLTARDAGRGIRPSGRQVQAVLESPSAAEQLTGTLDASARFTRRLLGVVSSDLAEPKAPLRFALNVGDGSFAAAQ